MDTLESLDDELVIEIGAGSVEDGTYRATLTAIDPLHVTVKDPDSGDDVERDLLRWTFALDDGREVEGVTSRATGPKSKMFPWLVALVGQDGVTAGARLTRKDLLGREAMIVVVRDKSGVYGKVGNVVPLPKPGLRTGA